MKFKSLHKNAIAKYANWIWIVFGVIIFNNCLTPIEFEGNAEATVIHGVLTNNEGERSVYVSRAKGIETDNQPIDASGFLFKDGQPVAEFSQQEVGILTLPQDFQIEAGAIYHVEVKTKDNQIYQSQPQVVAERRKTDSVSFEVIYHREEKAPDGTLRKIFQVDFFAHIDLPDEKDTTYYKWQIDRSWNFVSDSLTCYKTENAALHPIVLLSSEGRPKDRLKIRISSLDLDATFWYTHYLNAYLHTIDKNSYEFYQKALKLTQNIGNLYDEIPAPFKGNVFLSEGEEELVLGNIEFSLADTFRFRLDSFMLNTQINILRMCEENKDYCNLPCIYPCARPCPCIDCLSGGLDSYYGDNEKPYYFID